MDLSNIVKVVKTSSEREVNKLLKQGWILLSSGFNRGEVPGYDFHSYSLGLPKELADSLNEPNSEQENDYNF